MDVFKIDLETFCECWNVNDDCKSEISGFLISQNKQVPIEELYIAFLSRQDRHTQQLLESKLPDLDKWKNEKFLTGAIQKEMIKQLQEHPDIVNDGHKINHYHFPHYNGYNFYPGVILNQKIELNYNLASHQKLFRYLFASIFAQTENYELLFQYHLHNSFKNDKQKMNLFLFGVEKDYQRLISSGKKAWDYWIDLFNKGSVDKHEKTLTHREECLRHKFLVEAEIEKPLTAKQMKSISSKRYDAYLSFTPNSKQKTYKPPTKEELQNVIDSLEAFPKALEIAKKAGHIK